MLVLLAFFFPPFLSSHYGIYPKNGEIASWETGGVVGVGAFSIDFIVNAKKFHYKMGAVRREEGSGGDDDDDEHLSSSFSVKEFDRENRIL